VVKGKEGRRRREESGNGRRRREPLFRRIIALDPTVRKNIWTTARQLKQNPFFLYSSHPDDRLPNSNDKLRFTDRNCKKSSFSFTTYYWAVFFVKFKSHFCNCGLTSFRLSIGTDSSHLFNAIGLKSLAMISSVVKPAIFIFMVVALAADPAASQDIVNHKTENLVRTGEISEKRNQLDMGEI
jgi:hypothetical protein